jgi:hypothetical protein
MSAATVAEYSHAYEHRGDQEDEPDDYDHDALRELPVPLSLLLFACESQRAANAEAMTLDSYLCSA